MIDFTGYSYNDFQWEGRYVSFSSHAKMHLSEFKLDALEVIDMLNDPVPCPDSRRFRRQDVEICSRKHRKTFRIILADAFCDDVGEPCWCVENVKPT